MELNLEGGIDMARMIMVVRMARIDSMSIRKAHSMFEVGRRSSWERT